MSQEKKFYVYVHRYASGPKEGKVFYVGKGHGDRNKCIYKRNQHWNNVYKKYGMTPEIVFRFYEEACAFSFEMALISHYGRENLTNKTDGGEGVSGYEFTEEHRRKLSDAHTGRKHSPETLEKMSRYQSMFHPMRGKKHSDETRIKMSLERSGKKHALYNPEARYLVNDDGREFTGSRFDFYNKYSLDKSCVSKLFLGKIQKHKGWRIFQ